MPKSVGWSATAALTTWSATWVDTVLRDMPSAIRSTVGVLGCSVKPHASAALPAVVAGAAHAADRREEQALSRS